MSEPTAVTKPEVTILASESTTKQKILTTVIPAIVRGEQYADACKLAGISDTLLWLYEQKDADVQSALALARAGRAHNLADAIKRFADEVQPGNAKATEVKINTYKWLASKLLAKLYGDAPQSVVAVQSTGPLTVVMREEGRPSGYSASSVKDDPKP